MEGSRAFRSRNPSGHVFRVERRRGAVWYAKYRLPDGRQLQRKIGPAWPERGRPPAGYYTKRQAEEWLRDVLDQARKGTLAGLVRTGVTVDEAAAEFLRYLEHDRARKPATIRGYRWLIDGHVSPAFGDMRIEDVTPAMVEAWSATLPGTPASGARSSSRRTASSSVPAGHSASPRTRSPTSRSHRCAAAATSRSTPPRRSGRSSAPPTPNRTPRST
jgi:hypothetical protein